MSAGTGRHLDRLVPALELALAGWETRVPTGRLNSWLTELTAATPPPVRGGRQPKILFATQAGIRPPHFVLFATGFLEAGYRRFVERRLREEFGFAGQPGARVGAAALQARGPPVKPRRPGGPSRPGRPNGAAPGHALGPAGGCPRAPLTTAPQSLKSMIMATSRSL